MEPTRITATELSRNMSDVLSRVQYKGEHFKVLRNGEVIAELRPSEEGKRLTWGEFLKHWDSIPNPGPEYWDDVEEARRLMNQPLPEKTPWE